jgi:hypothetical protein
MKYIVINNELRMPYSNPKASDLKKCDINTLVEYCKRRRIPVKELLIKAILEK